MISCTLSIGTQKPRLQFSFLKSDHRFIRLTLWIEAARRRRLKTARLPLELDYWGERKEEEAKHDGKTVHRRGAPGLITVYHALKHSTLFASSSPLPPSSTGRKTLRKLGLLLITLKALINILLLDFLIRDIPWRWNNGYSRIFEIPLWIWFWRLMPMI